MDVLLNRVCGGCTACCKTHRVTEINKPNGKWCPDCNIGSTCNIYENRPAECQKFKCEWLKGFGEDSDRPDHTKIVLDYVRINGPEENNQVFQIWEVTEGTISKSFVRRMTDLATCNGIPVNHILLSGKVIFIPATKIAASFKGGR